MGLKKTIDRRAFLLKAGLAAAAILLNSCTRRLKPGKKYSHISGSLKGPDAKAGHLLRDQQPLPAPTSSRTIKTLIVGSGISGLSAARWLKQQEYHDFELIELENHSGGNARWERNEVSAYPLGAHYITIANNEDLLLTSFLQDCGVITGYEKGLPVYNEYYLCFDPEERLLINGEWQEGLIPDFGIHDTDREQIRAFFKLVNEFRTAKGSDGKFAFDIPLDNSSKEEQFRKLDRISFKDFLSTRNLRSPYLLWYLEYCCKDDYGQKIDTISAWAGIHYFAARRGRAANAEMNAVLTWPEGNGWLMEQLAATVKEHIVTGAMCYDVSVNNDGKSVVKIYQTATGVTTEIIADHVILGTPQFINKKILNKAINRPINYDSFSYSPWFVANITVSSVPQAKGIELCWDNVAYNTASVGYVNAGQQATALQHKKVLTWYLPLCGQDPAVARIAAYTRSYEQWLDIVVPELEYMHPGITNSIGNIDGWIWGHGMISPSVNYIWSENRLNACKPLHNTIFFAHTDLSGISVFEEAFHQGIRAAKEVVALNGKAQ